jgi:DNA-binding protein YbaB
MADEVLHDLYKLHRYATGLQGLVDDLQHRLPQRVDGQDSSGTVRATVDGEGLPVSVQVDYDWKRHLRPAAFGDAVKQAFLDAANRRLAAWSHAFNDADLPAQAERMRDRVDSEPAQPPPAPPPQQRSATPKQPRDPSALIRDFLDATSDLDAYATAVNAQGTGAAAYGKLTVTLSVGGAVSCTADPSWVSDKSGEELGEALHGVLASAREDLQRAVAAVSPAARTTKLLDEALALLRDSGT